MANNLLFQVPQRDTDRQSIKDALNRAKSKKKSPTTVRGGGGIPNQIDAITHEVDTKLGQYRDKYQLIQSDEILHDYITECIGNGYISIDTETTGLDPLLDQLAGICIYTRNQKGSYIPINHVGYLSGEKIKGQLPLDFVASEFNRLLEKKPQIDMFNASFDIRVLRHNQVPSIYCTWDGYLGARLLNENEQKGMNRLKPLHQKYVLKGKGDAFTFDELFKGIKFTLVPLESAYLYAAHDPVITTELCDYQRQFLREDAETEDMRQLYWVFQNIEMPCVSVVADMEDNGIELDLDYNAQLKTKYHALLDEREKAFIDSYQPYTNKIAELPLGKVDNPINIKSPQQLGVLLYDVMGCELFYDKKKKQYTRSTAEEALSAMDNDVAKAILSYREFSTLVDTFIDKLPNCVNPNDGKIHCSFNQYGASTGRFSSSEPNMQNIPSHVKDIRQMFRASDGCVLLSSDFSQQEPKTLAALCRKQGDSQLYDTFIAGKDLYSEIASKAFNKSYEECLEHFPKGAYIKRNGDKWYYGTPDDYDKIADGETDTYADGKTRRAQAKSILLGALYGRGEASIGEQLGCSTDKAKEIKSSVFRGFPAIKEFEDSSLKMAKDLGYVTTVCGRKRRLPELQLDEFEFKWLDASKITNFDPLDFEHEFDYSVPDSIKNKYVRQLKQCKFKDKPKIINRAKQEGIGIIDNGGKIADATRQCVNSRVQGGAADLTKLAMIKLTNNQRLKELGFKLLIPVHDEVICECPLENAKECAELLAETMCKAAEEILEMPINCDVEISQSWYGESIEV